MQYKYALIGVLLIVSMIAVSPDVYSAAFTSSVSPSTIDATTSTLLNFTINNIDSTQNITNLNITLPSGFTYLGNPNPTPSSTNGIIIWNGINIVAGTTQYFSFNVSSTVTGSKNFNVSNLDTASAFNSTNVAVTVNDVTSPQWSSNSTTPSSPSTYANGTNYTFNITWTDNIAISTVTFEFSGGNETVTAFATNKYGVTKTDLAAGVYTYKWFADDTSSNSNTTGALSFNVSKAPNTIDMYLNSNLNKNIEIINGTSLNVTMISKVGTISLYRNNTLFLSGGSPLTYSTTLDIGVYNFLANATGNVNYSDNATGTSFIVNVIYPAPRYSVVTVLPSTYTTGISIWNVTWTDDNDINGFNVSLIESNYAGTATNYTMFRWPGTNVSSYNASIPAGGFYYKIYANNSFNSFNSTNKTDFTIAKAVPIVTVSIKPDFEVYNYTQVNVSCTSTPSGLTLSLNKNSTTVSNPYVASLFTGYYQFTCNNTATQNHTSYLSIQYLTVVGYSVFFNFVSPPSVVLVEQNLTNTTSITLKNSGTEDQTISFTIDDLISDVWSSTSTSVSLSKGSSAVFVITFNSSKLEIGEYQGKFRAYNANRTVNSSFTLKVLPNNETKIYIDSKIAEYDDKFTVLEKSLNDSKTADTNITIAEDLLSQLKSQLTEAKGYLSEGDYLSAYQILGPLENLITNTTAEVNKISGTDFGSLFGILIIAIPVVVAAVVLLYLFLPPSKSSYSSSSGYKFEVPKKNILKEIMGKLSKHKEEDKKLKSKLDTKKKESEKK